MADIKRTKINLMKRKIHQRSHLFQTRPSECRFEVIRPLNSDSNADRTQLVNDASQLESIDTTTSKLFIARQTNTWSRINISRELFERFLDIYNVFPDIWKSVLPLGFKFHENECAFPGPSSRSTKNDGQDNCEISYVLRRVEEHGEKCPDCEQHECKCAFSPFSIRHTVVYHQLNTEDGKDPRSIFLLVSLHSTVFEDELSQVIQESTEEVNPWIIHWLLIADSTRGWTEYLSWMEFKIQSRYEPMIMATVGDENHRYSITNYKFTSDDRQDLSRFEEYISTLQIVLPTMLENINRVRDHYQGWAFDHGYSVDYLGLGSEFDEHILDVKRNIKRVEVLKDRLQYTIRLLTDLLSYEEACVLKSLALETQKEGKIAAQLAFQNAKDAAAVKVLTIISLIYLPTTIVANFFSTEFVKASNGKMQISSQSWILAAVALPLTSLTLGVWWVCVRLSPPVHPGDKEERSPQDSRDGIVGNDPEAGSRPQKEEVRILPPPRRQRAKMD